MRPLVAQTSLSSSLPSPQCAVHNKSCCHQLSASPWGRGFPAARDPASRDGREVPVCQGTHTAVLAADVGWAG